MRCAIALLGLALVLAPASRAAGPSLAISAPMPPPEWALLERELLRANTAACQEFFGRYFDARGYLMCVERWGGDDGPDDAIENVNDWPHLHALGAPDVILRLYKRAWEGHLRQYTAARTTEVPFARDGMYYREFPVMFDWQHNGEGLSVFNLQGLSDPTDDRFRQRVRRYAGFYMNEDPGAPNYDPQHRLIRSMINGSRGPMLRKATGLDWAGDPIDVENRFHLGHGERSYAEMLAHFKDYNDVAGDHPINLLVTTLALNAYMLDGEAKYRRWLLDYVDAWLERMRANGNIIPSNVGLDGKIGGTAGGKWYGGVYGWGFTVVVPQTGQKADRNRVDLAFVGMMNAYLLTGDDRYLDAWRRQADAINAQRKIVNGQVQTPRMYGDQGWYSYAPGEYRDNALELYYLSMRPEDRRRTPDNAWLSYLEGGNPGFPAGALRGELAQIRRKMEAMRKDTTTPDTRLADDPMEFNPASVTALIQLMEGGLHLTRRAAPLFCRLRYFDPDRRRAGIPPDCAALVDGMSASGVTVTLVNVNPVRPRTVTLQAGAYGEHQFLSVNDGSGEQPVNRSSVTLRLDPGCGARLQLPMKRFANPPSLSFPWDR